MRVLLTDDHQLVRAGLRALLETFGGVTVLAECGDGQEALVLTNKLQPDVLLLDLSLPGLNGIEVARRVPKLSPSTRVLVLSMHTSAEYVAQALRAGVAGYLVKDSAVEELKVALDSVSQGRTYLSPAISQTVVAGFLRITEETPAANPLDLLTSRQREILQLIAEGNGTRAIAERLDVSVKTVEAHRTQLMDRLDIHDVPSLVRLAVRHGLVPGEPVGP
ncbi:response regulator transcription factor [Myxococcus sp. CA051A]|uniref:Response regulator transcription factor n=1 Tax=Myxococcus llanfairpwllgwyngyllgogerychwyrndrobwllllantysiliogogogochensis TaxID=2590453 RepID=A0A540X1B1_9BACT|nr:MULTISPECIES: response regulator transcription factor [Myxococcus]NTX07934.1 response regulator transcription factor [Myxococcus sp. CA040A]NTX14835.1 response regulator transcription factor [Myxococcus sp. CA056]NTX40650.1 response regulator transcription factor [Myxococcus sp. CA033]NTX52645.1 response regulator transcription factor [Myxococcus sp. CA039A]NTX66669.1 response regulator transcription factor [Myxococcus sp. CA051A]